MDNSQLFVLAHKHLGSQHPVKIWNVDKVGIESHVSFICQKKKKKEKEKKSKTTLCHSLETIRKSSFIPLLDLGRHEMSLTSEDLDLR